METGARKPMTFLDTPRADLSGTRRPRRSVAVIEAAPFPPPSTPSNSTATEIETKQTFRTLLLTCLFLCRICSSNLFLTFCWCPTAFVLQSVCFTRTDLKTWTKIGCQIDRCSYILCAVFRAVRHDKHTVAPVPCVLSFESLLIIFHVKKVGYDRIMYGCSNGHLLILY